MSQPPTPLNDTERAELTAFLTARPGAMDLETLDGLFCALNLARTPPGAATWMPVALGDAALEWRDEAQRQRIVGLLAGKWREVADGFRDDWTKIDEEQVRERVYLPDVGLGSEVGVTPLAQRWATGFRRGLALAGTQTAHLLTPGGESHATLALIAGLEIGETASGEGLDREQRKRMLARVVIGLQHLHAARKRPAAASARPGRNEPCPCGSGKKYKKCCGSPTTG